MMKTSSNIPINRSYSACERINRKRDALPGPERRKGLEGRKNKKEEEVMVWKSEIPGGRDDLELFINDRIWHIQSIGHLLAGYSECGFSMDGHVMASIGNLIDDFCEDVERAVNKLKGAGDISWRYEGERNKEDND
jgi:hypothetical protein